MLICLSAHDYIARRAETAVYPAMTCETVRNAGASA
jgi:hypothetical protein